MRVGLAWCLVRFGEDTRALIGDQSAALAKQKTIREGVPWPEQWKDSSGADRGTRCVDRKIWDSSAHRPTELFGQMLGLLCDPDRYAAALLKRLLADAKKPPKESWDRQDLADVHPALAVASDDDLVAIFRVVWQTPKEAARKGSVPKGFELLPEQRVELIPIEVPATIWKATDGPSGRLASALFSLPALLLGEPMWIQEPELVASRFVMQFDADLVSINLGDNGIMYVFENTAFWQCY